MAHVNKRNTYIFGWKGALIKAQDTGNEILDNMRGVEEEDFGIFYFYGCIRGFTKVMKDLKDITSLILKEHFSNLACSLCCHEV